MIKKNDVPPTRGRESMGFPSPRAVPRGALRERAKRSEPGPPRDSPRGRQTQTLPTSCRRYIILFHHVFFIQTQRYVHTSPRGPQRYDHTSPLRGGRYDHTFEVSEGRYETFETQEIYEFVFIKHYFDNFHLQGNYHNDIWYKKHSKIFFQSNIVIF